MNSYSLIQSKNDFKEYETNYSLASLQQPIIIIQSDNEREIHPNLN